MIHPRDDHTRSAGTVQELLKEPRRLAIRSGPRGFLVDRISLRDRLSRQGNEVVKDGRKRRRIAAVRFRRASIDVNNLAKQECSAPAALLPGS